MLQRLHRFTLKKTEANGQSIVFFDGVCSLCNYTIRFILCEDCDRRFLLSPIQGETFKALTQLHPETVGTDSIFVLRSSFTGGDILTRSEAILYILSELPRFRWLARIGSIFPSVIRDSFYRLVATTRRKIWGRTTSCRILTYEEAARFLP
jgi:predicted DCC family thiol-disulfide oxidoreductase YuxK